MAVLEDITVGSNILGINGNEPVSVVAVQWYGSNVIEITYKDKKASEEANARYCDEMLHWSISLYAKANEMLYYGLGTEDE